MANIISIRELQPATAERTVEGVARSAEIILFPGVRYERSVETRSAALRTDQRDRQKRDWLTLVRADDN